MSSFRILEEFSALFLHEVQVTSVSFLITLGFQAPFEEVFGPQKSTEKKDLLFRYETPLSKGGFLCVCVCVPCLAFLRGSYRVGVWKLRHE